MSKDKNRFALIKYYGRGGSNPMQRVVACLDATRRKLEMVKQCCDAVTRVVDDTSDEGMALSGVSIVLDDTMEEVFEARKALCKEIERVSKMSAHSTSHDKTR